ncbi:MAG: hypothetical protein AAFY52_01655 [Pseudomonadota bacterium]
MTQAGTITFWNTALPLILAGVLAWVMPRFIAPFDTRSHWKVAVAVGASVVVLIFASAALFAATEPEKFARAADMGGLFLAIEIAVRGSLLFAFAWVPVLLLNWLSMAQRVEAWRGRDLAQEDRS